MHFFSCPKDHSTQKLEMCPVASTRTDTQAHTHTHTNTHSHRVTTEGILSGFHDFPLQPIIKDRPNTNHSPKRKKHPNVNIFICIEMARSESIHI